MKTSAHIDSRQRTDLGFTLIEMVAGLVLMAVLVAVFGMGLTTALEGYDFARNNTMISQKGAIAMTRMARELGELTNVIAVGDGDDPFIVYERITASNNSDRTRFGLRFDADTKAIYFYGPSDDLSNTFTETPYMLVDGVDSIELTLYNGTTAITNWSGSADIFALDTVQITLNLIRTEKADRIQTFITRVDTPNTGR